MSQITRTQSAQPARSGIVLRLAVAATALSLWAYVPYRYAVRPPHFEGFLASVYATLFPLSVVLALGALLGALRPERLERLGVAARASLGVYGGAWLLMGLLCIPSLTAMAAAAPFRGTLAMIHMTAQHAFLGLVAIGASWRPEAVAAILRGQPEPFGASQQEPGLIRSA